MENNNILTMEHVSYRYKDAKQNEYVLTDLNFTFQKGLVYAIKGKSGSGKTTLLSLLSGLETDYEGNIYFRERELRQFDLDRYRSRDIGIVFQSYNLLPHLSAAENIILSMNVSQYPIPDKKEKAVELMKRVGLSEDQKDRRVLKLSGGEQQRVAIARAVANNPSRIIADAPTGNLDPHRSLEIMMLLERINDLGTTVLVVAHEKSRVNRFTKRVVAIESGRVISDGTGGYYNNDTI